MLIVELEQKTGLDRATIRFYEKEGMITPVRLENGYRNYSDEDLDNLLKIKLLRLLGIPLTKIRELQQGSADFQSALQEQIEKLEADRDHAQRSAQICKLMQTDGITYDALNANYYLSKYKTAKPEFPRGPLQPTPRWEEFREFVPREYHPFRHFLARFLDYALLGIIIPFVQTVFFRTRLDTLVVGYLILLILWIPLEALCYTLFGTTPGKFAFGIQIEHRDGGNLDYRSAIKRSFGAFRYGLGWAIPFWSIWRLYKSFKNYDENEELEWNYESEITYHSFWHWQDKVKPLIVFAAIIAMLVTTLTLLNQPKYSGNELTLEQFALNYNAYLMPGGGNSVISMNEDGTFVNKQPNNGAVVIIGGRTSDEYANFEYIMEGDRVRGFTCSDQFTYRNMISVFETHYKMGIKALLAAQPGENSKSADKFLDELLKAVEMEMRSGKNSVSYENDSIIVQWSIQYEGNCVITSMRDELMLLVMDNENGKGSKDYAIETNIHVKLK